MKKLGFGLMRLPLLDGNNKNIDIEKLKDMVGELGFCDACFTGNYPMEVPGRDVSFAFE